MPYEPGAALAIAPRNQVASVEALLAATGCAGDAASVRLLTQERDISTLTVPMLGLYAGLIRDRALHALAADARECASFVAGKQAIDLFGAFPARLTTEQLLGLLRPLPPRCYSIASSRKVAADRVTSW